MTTMSTAVDDRPPAELRTALLEAAARLIATSGPGSLTLRRLAGEVGTSTMAVYTHFGGMRGLRRALRREGFVRLSARLTAVSETDDPVADLASLCVAYYEYATADSQLYRVVFMEEPLGEDDAVVGSEPFAVLVDGVQRCIAAGAFDEADPTELATQIWMLGHGGVTLQLARLLTDQQVSTSVVGALLLLFTGYGVDREAARRSMENAFHWAHAAAG
jgi:AcrR family transcriptional regulator